MELPPLPEARKPDEHGAGWFTAGQMIAFRAEGIAAAIAEEREANALLCEQQGAEWDSDAVQTFKNYAEHCAALIRAKSKVDEPCTLATPCARCGANRWRWSRLVFVGSTPQGDVDVDEYECLSCGAKQDHA